jgi:hypothetical protein
MLMMYQERIVEVLGEARGERVMIRSVHADRVERRRAVKWVNLLPLNPQLFYLPSDAQSPGVGTKWWSRIWNDSSNGFRN